MRTNYTFFSVFLSAVFLAGLNGLAAEETAPAPASSPAPAPAAYADLSSKTAAEKITIIRKAAAEKDINALPALMGLLKTEKDRNVMVNTFSALGQIGQPGEKNEVSAALIEKVKTESDPVLQYAAVTSVMALTTKDNASDSAEAVKHANKFPADNHVKDLTDKVIKAVEEEGGSKAEEKPEATESKTSS